jgi:hypothetical protein
MGHGASRELAGKQELRVLPEGLSKAVAQALTKMDESDEEFKKSRVDERYSQISMLWSNIGVDMAGHLRIITDAILANHQLSLEIGSDGGGLGAKPFVEESSFKIERLYFGLEQEEERMKAYFADTVVSRVALLDITYEWVEKAVCTWIVHATRAKIAETAA